MLFLLLACDSAPAAGELRTDTEELATRMLLPPELRGARWTMEAARVGTTQGGRADAFLYVWLDVGPGTHDWLTETVGASLGRRVHWVPGRLATLLLTPDELSLLQRDATHDRWKLACDRWMGAGLGRREYRGQVVTLCGDRLWVTLSAR